MKRSALLIVVCLALAWSTVAFAAGLPLVPEGLGAGSATVSRCDDAFSIAYSTSGGNVTSATVGGVDAQCDGGTLWLTLVDSGYALIGSGGPVQVTGGSVTVPIDPEPFAGDVAGFRVTIVGGA